MLGGQSGLPPRPYDGRRGAFAGLTGLGKKPDSGLEIQPYYQISCAELDLDYPVRRLVTETGTGQLRSLRSRRPNSDR